MEEIVKKRSASEGSEPEAILESKRLAEAVITAKRTADRRKSEALRALRLSREGVPTTPCQ